MRSFLVDFCAQFKLYGSFTAKLTTKFARFLPHGQNYNALFFLFNFSQQCSLRHNIVRHLLAQFPVHKTATKLIYIWLHRIRLFVLSFFLFWSPIVAVFSGTTRHTTLYDNAKFHDTALTEITNLIRLNSHKNCPRFYIPGFRHRCLNRRSNSTIYRLSNERIGTRKIYCINLKCISQLENGWNNRTK